MAKTTKEELNEAVATPEVEEVVEETKAELAVQGEDSMREFQGLDLAELGFSEEDLKTLTGMENVDSSEISIPYATLVAKKTRDHDIGDIVFPDGKVIKGLDGEFAEEISVLKIQPVRVYFPTPFNPKSSYICRSLDGKVGAPDGEYAGRPCSACEFSEYPEAGGASPCRDQRLLLCSASDGSLFHLQIGGVGVGIWKKFMSAQVFHLLPKAKNILGFLKMKLGVRSVDTNYGPFPAIDFKIDSSDPFHSIDRLKENLNSLKAYKEFETFHVSSAADAARVQAAAGEENVSSETGAAPVGQGEANPNAGLF